MLGRGSPPRDNTRGPHRQTSIAVHAVVRCHCLPLRGPRRSAYIEDPEVPEVAVLLGERSASVRSFKAAGDAVRVMNRLTGHCAAAASPAATTDRPDAQV